MKIELDLRTFLKFDVLLVSTMFVFQFVHYFYSQFGGIKVVVGLFLIWFTYIHVIKTDTKKLYQNIVRSKYEFISLGIFCLVVLISYAFVNSSGKALGYFNTFVNFLIVLIVDSYYRSKDLRYRYAVLYICLVALFLQAIYSVPYLYENIGISRGVTSGRLQGGAYIEALKNGVGNYSLYSSSVIFIFPVLRMISDISSYTLKYIGLLMVVGLVVPVFISTFTSPIALLLLGVGLYYYFNLSKALFRFKNFLYTMLMIIIVVYVFDYLLTETEFLRQANRRVELLSAGYSPTDRVSLLQVSLNSFLSNPLFGIGVPEWGSYQLIGEHSVWVDFLAHFGLLGTIPFYTFFIIRIKKRFGYLGDVENQHQISFLKIGIILFLTINFVNPVITVPNDYIYFLFFVSATNSRL